MDSFPSLVTKQLFLILISGDELLSDSFPYKELENGMIWEVEGKVSRFCLLYAFSLFHGKKMLCRI